MKNPTKERSSLKVGPPASPRMAITSICVGSQTLIFFIGIDEASESEEEEAKDEEEEEGTNADQLERKKKKGNHFECGNN